MPSSWYPANGLPRPEQMFQSLATEADTGLPMSETTVAAAFAKLQPVDSAYLTKGAGEWKGHDVNTGHPATEKLKELRWAGKTFRGVDDVDPVVVYDAEGTRVWDASWGHAQASSRSSSALRLANKFECHIVARNVIWRAKHHRDGVWWLSRHRLLPIRNGRHGRRCYGLEEDEAAWDVLFLLDEDILRSSVKCLTEPNQHHESVRYIVELLIRRSPCLFFGGNVRTISEWNMYQENLFGT